MPTGSYIYEIQLGAAPTTTTQITLLTSGSAGTLGARRTLTHPDAQFAPITYDLNPHRTLNLDNDVLFTPRRFPVKTLGTTKVLAFTEAIDDVIVTEIWQGDDRRAAMTTALFRRLYTYFVNPPVVTQFITWAPRDRNTKTYQVELLSLSVGATSDESPFDVLDLRNAAGPEIQSALEGLDTVTTGFVDRLVALRMKVVAEVTS